MLQISTLTYVGPVSYTHLDVYKRQLLYLSLEYWIFWILSIHTYEFSGDASCSLQYLFRIPPCTIGRIVPEVCQAIYDNLKEEYLKVCVKSISEQIIN